MRPHDIYDSVHGYIHITAEGDDIVADPYFQRLRRVHQLGLGNMVFPSAEHTRFSHSLGVMHIVTKMVDALNNNVGSNSQLIDKDDKNLLRVAGLLHDVGHMPFSHFLEDVAKSMGSTIRHEDLAGKIIKETGLKDEVEKAVGNKVEEVISLINKTYELDLDEAEKRGQTNAHVLNSLISSELDADRIDYLLRDAYHIGIPYGSFDLNRILNTMIVAKTDDGSMVPALKRKARLAAENYIMARLHMYEAVYLHKTIGAFNCILRELYIQGINEGILPSFEEMESQITEDSFFCTFDDYYVLSQILHHDYRSDHHKKLKKMFIERRPLKLAYEVKKSRGTVNPHDVTASWIALTDISKIKDEFCKKYGLKPESIFFEEPKLSALKVKLDTADYEDAIYIEDGEGHAEPINKNKESFVESLLKYNMDVKRVYTFEESVEKVKEAIKKEIGKKKEEYDLN